ncbi:UNVERIFIED_CONTAM: DNA-directed RNA polymerase V subunit [Sesamum radiatum]|uniref:DNA-directed RNA polymerase subunit n=2 Tax=Sesamum TaxID=4181 RepID=A0AAW2S7I4_SESRA
MFLRSQLSWNVVIPAQNLDAEGLILQKAILIGLLDEFAAKKASKDIGYFLAVTTLDHIGKGIIRQHSGDLLFPVDFSCITFKMFPGEILEGVVHKILKHGVFVKCGPAEKVYISHLKMADYQYVPGENPCFRNEKSSKIEKGTVVRFLVLAEKYDEAEKDFRAVVSLEGDFLGPIN